MSKTNSLEQDFEYLTKILAFLLYEDFCSTPENISKALKVPVEQVRQDFTALLSIDMLKTKIHPISKQIMADFDVNNKELWKRQMLSGFYDHAEFALDAEALYMNCKSGFSSETQIPIWLKPIEFLQLKTQYPYMFKSKFQSSGIKIKSPTPVFNKTDVILKYATALSNAITSKTSISIRYERPPVSGTFNNRLFDTFIIYPQYLYHDTDKSLIYCIALEKEVLNNNDISLKIFRLDRIRKIEKVPKSAPLSISNEIRQYLEDMRQKLDYMWGMSSFDEEPVPVKVRIYANTANIISKIKAETSLRKYGKLTQDGNDYIYTDTIIGTANFRSWLRGYGSSVVVMEPKELADEMKESALKVIQLYAGTDNCQDS